MMLRGPNVVRLPADGWARLQRTGPAHWTSALRQRNWASAIGPAQLGQSSWPRALVQNTGAKPSSSKRQPPVRAWRNAADGFRERSAMAVTMSGEFVLPADRATVWARLN